MLITVFKNS